MHSMSCTHMTHMCEKALSLHALGLSGSQDPIQRSIHRRTRGALKKYPATRAKIDAETSQLERRSDTDTRSLCNMSVQRQENLFIEITLKVELVDGECCRSETEVVLLITAARFCHIELLVMISSDIGMVLWTSVRVDRYNFFSTTGWCFGRRTHSLVVESQSGVEKSLLVGQLRRSLYVSDIENKVGSTLMRRGSRKCSRTNNVKVNITYTLSSKLDGLLYTVARGLLESSNGGTCSSSLWNTQATDVDGIALGVLFWGDTEE
ncbi:hypothetical protein Tco_0052404 [Tanacetum coccineum]